jgi:hypothetical protein
MKSPLKSNIQFKSIGELKKIIRPGSTVSSFFLYSGDVEIALASVNRTVVAHTNKYAVYEFWATLMKGASTLYEAVNYIYPTISGPEFYLLQENWTGYKDSVIRSVLFFILNRCSDSGMVSCGKIDRNNFNPIALSYLRNFELDNFYPFLDKSDEPLSAIDTAKETDYILLPVGKYSLNLFEYGKSKGPDTTTINHRALHKKLKTVDKKWILLYKKHGALFSLYSEYNIKMIDKYGRLTGNKDKCEEIIIANF